MSPIARRSGRRADVTLISLLTWTATWDKLSASATRRSGPYHNQDGGERREMGIRDSASHLPCVARDSQSVGRGRLGAGSSDRKPGDRHDGVFEAPQGRLGRAYSAPLFSRRDHSPL